MKFSTALSEDLKKRVAAKVLLIFFGLMVILTFFSKTINNYTFPKVVVQKPVQGSLLKSVSGDGIVEALKKTDVYYDGNQNVKIEDIRVKPGDTVKKGDVLISFRKNDVEEQSVQDGLLLEKLRMIYTKAKKVHESRTGITAWKRAADEAKYTLDEAKSKLDTASKLYASGEKSKVELQLTKKAVELAEKAYGYSMEDYNAAYEKEGVELEKLRYDLEMQEQKVSNQQSVIKSGYNVISPHDGTVQDVNVTKDMYVNNSVKLCTVEDPAMGFEFKAEVDAKDSSFIKVGDTATVSIESLGAIILNGNVVKISDSAMNKGIMKEVSVAISSDMISGGEKGEVSILKNTKDFSMIVPNSTVLPGNSTKDGYVRILKVKEGFIGNEYYIAIVNVFINDVDSMNTAISGVLSSDDRIVVKCDKPLYDNSRVIIDRQLEDQ